MKISIKLVVVTLIIVMISASAFAGTLSSVNDYEIPTVRLTVCPNRYTYSRTAYFSWTGSDDVTPVSQLLFRYRLNNSSWSGYSSITEVTYPDISQGNHTFEVQSKDTSGKESVIASYTFTADFSIPSVSLSTKPDSLINYRNVDFTWTGNDSFPPSSVLLYQWKLDNGLYNDWTSSAGVQLKDLSQGNHTFHVRAMDAAGNISVPAQHNFTIDLTKPMVTILTKPDTLIRVNYADFSWYGSDPFPSSSGLMYQWKLDTNPYSAWSSGTSANISGLSQGIHTFYVRAKDEAGNISDELSYSFTVDTSYSQLYFLTGPSGWTRNNTPSFIWQGASSLYAWKLGSNPYSNLSSATSTTLGPLSDSTSASAYVFYVKSIDSFGNEIVISRSFGVDTIAPTVSITYPANNATYNVGQIVNANWTAYDNRSGLASAIGTNPSGSRIYTEKEGTYTFTVTAFDNAGNKREITHTYRVISTDNKSSKTIFEIPGKNDKGINPGSSVPVMWRSSIDYKPNTIAKIYIDNAYIGDAKYNMNNKRWMYTWKTKKSMNSGMYEFKVIIYQNGYAVWTHSEMLKVR